MNTKLFVHTVQITEDPRGASGGLTAMSGWYLFFESGTFKIMHMIASPFIMSSIALPMATGLLAETKRRRRATSESFSADSEVVLS